MIRDNAPGHTYFISKEIKTKTWPKADGLTLVTTLLIAIFNNNNIPIQTTLHALAIPLRVYVHVP